MARRTTAAIVSVGFQADTGKFTSGVGRVNRSMRDSRFQANKLQGQLKQVGNSLTRSVPLLGAMTNPLGLLAAGAVAGAVAIGKLTSALKENIAEGVRFAQQYEQIETRLVNLAGLTQTEAQSLASITARQAADIGIDPIRAAEAAYRASSGGLSPEQARQAVVAAAQAEIIGFGTTEENVGLLINLFQNYGDELGNFNQIMGIFAAVVRNGDIELNQFIPAIKQTIPLAASLGVSAADLGAAFAVVATGMGDTARGGTALRAFLVALQKPTKEGEKLLAQYGLSIEGLQRTLREDGFAALTTQLVSAGVTDQDAARIFSSIEAYQAWLQLQKNGGQDQINLQKEIRAENEDTFNALYGRAAEDSINRITAAQTRNANAWREVGQALLPVTTAFSEFSSNVGTFAAETILAVINGISSFVGWIESLIDSLERASEALSDFFDSGDGELPIGDPRRPSLPIGPTIQQQRFGGGFAGPQIIPISAVGSQQFSRDITNSVREGVRQGLRQGFSNRNSFEDLQTALREQFLEFSRTWRFPGLSQLIGDDVRRGLQRALFDIGNLQVPDGFFNNLTDELRSLEQQEILLGAETPEERDRLSLTFDYQNRFRQRRRQLEIEARDIEATIRNLEIARDRFADIGFSDEVNELNEQIALNEELLSQNASKLASLNNIQEEQNQISERAIDIVVRRRQEMRELQREIDEQVEQEKRLRQVTDDVGASFARNFEQAVFEAKKFSDIVKDIINDLVRSLLRAFVFQPLQNLISNQLFSLPGFAQGGYAGSGLAVVGELGPEIVDFKRPARVYPTDYFENAGNGGGGNIFNISSPVYSTDGPGVRKAQEEFFPVMVQTIETILLNQTASKNTKVAKNILGLVGA